MYQGLVHLHNVLRWVILIGLLINLLRHVTAMSKPFAAADKKMGLLLMIAAHLTLLLGLGQYFLGDFGAKLFAANGVGVVMKNAALRFWAVEHVTGMLIGILLITFANGISRKKWSDIKKHRTAFTYYLLALVIILAVVPWPFRQGIGRPWFPGM